jgi:hypothetical protein
VRRAQVLADHRVLRVELQRAHHHLQERRARSLLNGGGKHLILSGRRRRPAAPTASLQADEAALRVA